MDLFKLQLPLTNGDSGSPVLNDRGEVIGVVSMVPLVWSDTVDAYMNRHRQVPDDQQPVTTARIIAELEEVSSKEKPLFGFRDGCSDRFPNGAAVVNWPRRN